MKGTNQEGIGHKAQSCAEFGYSRRKEKKKSRELSTHTRTHLEIRWWSLKPFPLLLGSLYLFLILSYMTKVQVVVVVIVTGLAVVRAFFFFISEGSLSNL